MALNKHPLLVLAIAFAAGIILSTLLNTPGLTVLILMAGLTLGLFFLTKKKVSPIAEKAFLASIVICFVMTGWLLADFSAQIPANDPSSITGSSTTLTGTVLEDSRKTKHGFKTTMAVNGQIRGKILLYFPPHIKPPMANDLIRLDAKINALSGSNKGYLDWLHQQGIHASANATSYEKTGVATGFLASIKALRRNIGSRFSQLIPDANMAGLAKAMLLGDRTDLDSDLRADFSSAGLSHVLAISGMHLGILYVALQALLSFMLYLPLGRQIRAVILILTLAGFAVFTGGNPAICRAAIMLGLLELGQSFWQKNYSLNALAISALAFLCFDPQALFFPGFQLSYAAVLGILLFQQPLAKYLSSRVKKMPRQLTNALAVTLTAQAATAPLVAIHFHSFPTYFLFANLLLLPFVVLAANIGFAGFILAWVPGLDTAWAGILDFLLEMLGSGAEILAELPGSTITSLDPSQTGIWVLIAQIIIFAGILERKYIKKAFHQLFGKPSSRTSEVALSGLSTRALVTIGGITWALGGFIF